MASTRPLNADRLLSPSFLIFRLPGEAARLGSLARLKADVRYETCDRPMLSEISYFRATAAQAKF